MRFSETLVAFYTFQVLTGLQYVSVDACSFLFFVVLVGVGCICFVDKYFFFFAFARYLHQQGVVHRDIKGANILCTKEAQLKLADFGVATDTDEFDGVVGTPYWMAVRVVLAWVMVGFHVRFLPSYVCPVRCCLL